MYTNNQYYKKILEKLTSTTISGNHTDNYYIRRIAQHYGVEDTNKCNGRLLKAIAEILTETTFGEFHFINFYLKKIAETLSRHTYPTVHSDNFYLGVFCEYCVALPYTDISAWTDDEIISYNGGTNPESATLSAQLLNGESEAKVEDVTISFKVSKKGTSDVIATLSADTDADGYASVSYVATGVGDVCVETKIEGTSLIQTYEIEDCDNYDPLTSASGKWAIPSGATVTYSNEGMRITANAYKQIKFTEKLTSPCSVEFKITDYQTNGTFPIIIYQYTNGETTPNQLLLTQEGDSNLNVLGTLIDHPAIRNAVYRIEYDTNQMRVYENDVLLGSATNSIGFPTRFEVHTGTNRYTVYKDLKIKPL